MVHLNGIKVMWFYIKMMKILTCRPYGRCVQIVDLINFLKENILKKEMLHIDYSTKLMFNTIYICQLKIWIYHMYEKQCGS